MIDLAALLAFTLRASTEVTDVSGRHFRRISEPAALAMTEGCARRNLFPADDTGRRCTTMLLVMAGREGMYFLDPCAQHIPGATCDHGRAKGPFQEWIAEPPKTWGEAVEHYISTIQNRAMRYCGAHWLASLATGSCNDAPGPGSERVGIERARLAEVERVIAAVPWGAQS